MPRCSRNEEKIQDWIKGWAHNNNVPLTQDGVGNILMTREPAPGCEDYPTLTLQGHMDMVCEKERDSPHDFETDPIPARVEGDVVKADGTSLGADNGIGMALAMALISDPELKRHGRIEALLTVDEETGLTGATMMKPGFFKGKSMINLDSEELGFIIIGSAGGGGTQYTVSSTLGEAPGWEGVRLGVDGLMGGHSGVDIHLPRINANKLVCEGLEAVRSLMPLRIARIEGGTRGNAIPRSASCEFQVPAGGADKAIEALRRWDEKIDRAVEKDLKVSASRASIDESLSEEASASIIGIVSDAHQGPVSWSKEIEGLVQTSNNIGIVRTEQDKVVISISSRTSDAEDLKMNQATLKGIGERHGAEVSQREGGSGWKPDPSSPFLALVKRNYEKVYGRDVKVTAIHAGLECGVLTGRDPELKAVSIGPDIKYPHSPGEHVYIKSVGVLWRVLKAVAQEMGGESAS